MLPREVPPPLKATPEPPAASQPEIQPAVPEPEKSEPPISLDELAEIIRILDDEEAEDRAREEEVDRKPPTIH